MRRQVRRDHLSFKQLLPEPSSQSLMLAELISMVAADSSQRWTYHDLEMYGWMDGWMDGWM